jgi:hypothetical protein
VQSIDLPLQGSRRELSSIQTPLWNKLLEPIRHLSGELDGGYPLSSDIIELEEAAKSKLPLDILNPVNRLSDPVLDRGMQEERLVFQEFLAQRFTHHDDIMHSNIYYLNGTVNLAHMRDMRQFYVGI